MSVSLKAVPPKKHPRFRAFPNAMFRDCPKNSKPESQNEQSLDAVPKAKYHNPEAKNERVSAVLGLWFEGFRHFVGGFGGHLGDQGCPRGMFRGLCREVPGLRGKRFVRGLGA